MAAVSAEQVYLAQGQLIPGAPIPGAALSPTIEQCVGVAVNDHDLYQCLANTKPGFRPLGFATLADYEDTAKKIRACLKSDSPSWEVVLAPGMSVK